MKKSFRIHDITKLLSNFKIQVILIVIAISFLIALPFMNISSYWMNNFVKVGVYVILGLALNILVGYTGLVSLGQAGFVAIGAYTTTVLVKDFQLNFFVAALIGAVISALFGLLLGLPTLRVRGTYLSIITLGFGEIIRTLIIVWEPVTNGPMGIRNIPSPVLFGQELSFNNGGLYYLVLILLALTVIFCYFLYNSKTGRAFRAIKADEYASIMMGINTTYYKTLAFVLAAVISGLAGSLFAIQLGYIDQNTFTFDMSTLILSIVILGGMGTIRGMFIGAILLVILPEVSRSLMQYRFVLYGANLVLMMRFLPQGILGWKPKSPYRISQQAQNLFTKGHGKLTGFKKSDQSTVINQ